MGVAKTPFNLAHRRKILSPAFFLLKEFGDTFLEMDMDKEQTTAARICFPGP